jgi:hypothetical protein
MRTTTTLILLLLPFLAALAQDEIADEQEEIRRYTVEMIIFKYAQDVSTGSEIFPGDAPVYEDQRGESQSPRDERPRRYRDVERVALKRDEFSMGDIMSRLRRLDAYQPVMHFGWTQTTWPEEETRAIRLSSLARPPAGLNGTLRLYLSRFLHLVVDLEMDAPSSAALDAAVGEPASDSGDYRRLEGPVRYRINEDRIFRSGELRYFDHPKFVVLARITRVDEDSNGLSDTEDGELLGYPPE